MEMSIEPTAMEMMDIWMEMTEMASTTGGYFTLGYATPNVSNM
jgi:hypothetical protein